MAELEREYLARREQQEDKETLEFLQSQRESQEQEEAASKPAPTVSASTKVGAAIGAAAPKAPLTGTDLQGRSGAGKHVPGKGFVLDNPPAAPSNEAPGGSSVVKDSIAGLAKVGGGIAKGVTLGAVDPLSGTVGAPLGLSDRFQYAMPLSEALKEFGATPTVAESRWGDSTGEMIGSAAPMSVIARTFTLGVRSLLSLGAGRELVAMTSTGAAGRTFLADAWRGLVERVTQAGAGAVSLSAYSLTDTANLTPREKLEHAKSQAVIGAAVPLAMTTIAPAITKTAARLSRAIGDRAFDIRLQAINEFIQEAADDVYGKVYNGQVVATREQAFGTALTIAAKRFPNAFDDLPIGQKIISKLGQKLGRTDKAVEGFNPPQSRPAAGQVGQAADDLAQGGTSTPTAGPIAPAPLNPAQLQAILNIKQPRPLPYGWRTPREIARSVENHNWAILTAENPQHPDAVAVPEGGDRNEVMLQWLLSKGYTKDEIVPSTGFFEGIPSDKGFLVLGITPEDVVEHLKNFGQDSTAMRDGLLYHDGTLNPAAGGVVVGEAAKTQVGYSILHGAEGNVPFSINLDFSQKAPHPFLQGGYNPLANERGEVLVNPGVDEFAGVAEAYEAAVHNPNDPAVKASYDALKQDVITKYQQLTDAGYKLELFEGEGQPYPSHEEMLKDLDENKHLWVFKGGEPPADHPLSEPVPGLDGLTYNHLFRFVHDAIDHGVSRGDFSRVGETAAYRQGTQGYSQAARPAYFTETMGQLLATEKLNDFDFNKPIEQIKFSEQKAALLPETFYTPKQERTLGSKTFKQGSVDLDSPVKANEFLSKKAADGEVNVNDIKVLTSPEGGRAAVLLPDGNLLFRATHGEAMAAVPASMKNQVDKIRHLVLDVKTPFGRALVTVEGLEDIREAAKIGELKRTIKEETPPSTAFNKLQQEADRARQRLDKRFKGKFFDVTGALAEGAGTAKDLMIIGAANVLRGFKAKQQWNAEMKKYFPDLTNKELAKIREKADAFIDKQYASKGGENLGKRIPELLELIDAGFVSPDWYEHAWPLSVKMFPGGEADAAIFWAIKAGMSPQTQVDVNVDAALEVFRYWKKHGTEGMADFANLAVRASAVRHRAGVGLTDAHIKNMINVVSQLERNPTKENLLNIVENRGYGEYSVKVPEYIYAIAGRKTVPVIDSHLADAFGFRSLKDLGQTPGAARRELIKAWVSMDAKQHGVTPVAMQANYWVANKAWKAVDAEAHGLEVDVEKIRGTIEPLKDVFIKYAKEQKENFERSGVNLNFDDLFPDQSKFNKWFEGSRVVDANGNPLTVYHGTKRDFKDFAPDMPGVGSTIFGSFETKRAGFFFSESPSVASEFATQGSDITGANVRPVNLVIRKPLDLTVGFNDDNVLNALEERGLNSVYYAKLRTGEVWEAFDYENGGKELVAALKKIGYDGAKIIEPGVDGGADSTTWVAFDKDQIRSTFEGQEGFAKLGFIMIMSRALIGAGIGALEGDTIEDRIENALLGAGVGIAAPIAIKQAGRLVAQLLKRGNIAKVANELERSGLAQEFNQLFNPPSLRKPGVPPPAAASTRGPAQAGSAAAGAPGQVFTGMAPGAPSMIPPPRPEITEKPKFEIKQLTPDQIKAFRETDPSVIDIGDKMMKVNWNEVTDQTHVEEILTRLTAMNTDAIDAARRGKISVEKTKEMARKLGLGYDDILARRKGQALNAEEAQAFIDLGGSALKHTIRLMEELELQPGNADIEEEFVNQLNVMKAIHEQIMGARAESGRALPVWGTNAQGYIEVANQLVTTANTLMPQNASLRGSVQITPTRLAQMIKHTLGGDLKKVSQFIDKATRPGISDAFFETMYGLFFLSNPKTLAVNALGGALTTAMAVPERMLAAGVGTISKGLEAIGLVSPQVDHVSAREAAAMVFGMANSVDKALQIAAHAFETGEGSTARGKIELSPEAAITAENFALTGPLGHMVDYLGQGIRLGMRGLMSTDEFFKVINGFSQVYSNAWRAGEAQGLEGDEFAKFVIERFRDLPPEDLKQAREYADYVTFTKQLGQSGQFLQMAMNSLPLKYRIPLKLNIPFFTVPVNLFKYAAERIPGLAFLHQSFLSDMKAGGARRDLAMGRLLLGTGLVVTAGYYALQGRINGHQADDRSERFIEKTVKKQEYSAVADDGTQFSFERLDPWGMILGFGADYANIVFGNPNAEVVDKLVLSAVLPVAWNLTSKTYLEGAVRMMKAIVSGRANDIEQWFKRQASVVVPAIAREINRSGLINDRYIRDARGAWDNIIAQTPGYSDSISPDRDAFGHPVLIPGGLGPDVISPIAVSKRRNEPHYKALLDAKIQLTPPGDTIMGTDVPEGLSIEDVDPRHGIPLTPQQADRYKVLAGHGVEINGKNFEQSVKSLVASSEWESMTDYQKQIRVSGLYQQYKSLARYTLLGEFKDLQEKQRAKIIERQKALGVK